MAKVVRLLVCLIVLSGAGCPSRTVSRKVDMATGAMLYNNKSLQHWLDALQDPKAEVRKEAVDVLELIADPKDLGAQTPAVALALGKAAADKDASVRKTAVRALGKLEAAAAPAVPDLIAALENDEARRGSLSVLFSVGPPAKDAMPALLKLLKHPDKYTRQYAAQALSGVAPDAKETVPALIELLKDKEVAGEAAYRLGRIGPRGREREAVPLLLQIFETGDTTDRGRAAFALGAMGEEGKVAIPRLVAAVKAKDSSVYWNAAFALVRLGEPEIGIAVVREILKSDSLAVVLVVENLGDMCPGSKTGVPILVKELKDPDPRVRWFAAFALKRIGPDAKEAVPALVDAMKDKDELVRDTAADALKKIDPDAYSKAR